MDAITLIKKDHQAVEALFKRFEKVGDGAHKEQRKLVNEMIAALSKHTAIEEALLYPTLRVAFEDEDQDELVLQALEEHHVVKWTLAELEKLQPTDERFCPKVTVLIDLVRRHIQEEESQLLSAMRERMKPKLLQELGKRMEQAKRLAPIHPHPRSPDSPPGNLVASPMAAVLDRGFDLVRELVKSGAQRTQSAAREVAGDVAARGRKAVRSVSAPRKGRKGGASRKGKR